MNYSAPKCRALWRRHKWNAQYVCERCGVERNPAAKPFNRFGRRGEDAGGTTLPSLRVSTEPAGTAVPNPKYAGKADDTSMADCGGGGQLT